MLKVFSLSVFTITVEYFYYLYSLTVTLFDSTPHLDKKPLFLNLDLRPIATLHLKSDSWDSTEGALVSQKKLPEWLLWWMKYFFFNYSIPGHGLGKIQYKKKNNKNKHQNYLCGWINEKIQPF